MTTGETKALTRRTFVGKVMSLFLTCCLGWQNTKEQQGETREPSSVISTKKQRKTVEQERLLNKIRDTMGTFHSKMGSIKDRNGMGLTEVEDIKKRW